MAVRIVVLSDGTWQAIGGSKVYTITEDAYDNLLDGNKEIDDLTAGDVLDSVEIQ